MDIPTKDATNELFPNVPFVKDVEEYGTLLDVDKAKKFLAGNQNTAGETQKTGKKIILV
ncbi:MAG: hypothetical protein CM15mP129_07390 [Chloroflexota bacterium]|nr:MAG: hypothetical protein CM15mP129_07390 [Chloroflexota bacterium]